MSKVCVSCRLPIEGIICYSGLFGSNNKDILCEGCSNSELETIDKEGTNDLPELLKTYKKPMQKNWKDLLGEWYENACVDGNRICRRDDDGALTVLWEFKSSKEANEAFLCWLNYVPFVQSAESNYPSKHRFIVQGYDSTLAQWQDSIHGGISVAVARAQVPNVGVCSPNTKLRIVAVKL